MYDTSAAYLAQHTAPPGGHVNQYVGSGHPGHDTLPSSSSYPMVNFAIGHSSGHDQFLFMASMASLADLVKSKPSHISEENLEAFRLAFASHEYVVSMANGDPTSQEYARRFHQVFINEEEPGTCRKFVAALKYYMARKKFPPKYREDVLKALQYQRRKVTNSRYYYRVKSHEGGADGDGSTATTVTPPQPQPQIHSEGEEPLLSPGNDTLEGKEIDVAALHSRMRKKRAREMIATAQAFSRHMEEAGIDHKGLSPQEIECVTRNMNHPFGGDRRKAAADLITYLKVRGFDVDDIQDVRMTRTRLNRLTSHSRLRVDQKKEALHAEEQAYDASDLAALYDNYGEAWADVAVEPYTFHDASYLIPTAHQNDIRRVNEPNEARAETFTPLHFRNSNLYSQVFDTIKARVGEASSSYGTSMPEPSDQQGGHSAPYVVDPMYQELSQIFQVSHSRPHDLYDDPTNYTVPTSNEQALRSTLPSPWRERESAHTPPSHTHKPHGKGRADK
ncbi:hypothetical protein CBS101457_003123 [Exobasidium rhododendri]|nr:hypothetical protein CBS101457_003123 [Exobasidium rhododendri]